MYRVCILLYLNANIGSIIDPEFRMQFYIHAYLIHAYIVFWLKMFLTVTS